MEGRSAQARRAYATHWVVRTSAGLPWCRFCGETSAPYYSDGPWGANTLCSKHGYLWEEAMCGLDNELSRYRNEQLFQREHPVLQDYCCICQKGGGECGKSNPLVTCDGCPLAYHRKCFPTSLPPEVLKFTEAWFCTQKCVVKMLSGLENCSAAETLRAIHRYVSPNRSHAASGNPSRASSPSAFVPSSPPPLPFAVHVAFASFVPVSAAQSSSQSAGGLQGDASLSSGAAHDDSAASLSGIGLGLELDLGLDFFPAKPPASPGVKVEASAPVAAVATAPAIQNRVLFLSSDPASPQTCSSGASSPLRFSAPNSQAHSPRASGFEHSPTSPFTPSSAVRKCKSEHSADGADMGISQSCPSSPTPRPFICQFAECRHAYKRLSHLRQHYRRSHSGSVAPSPLIKAYQQQLLLQSSGEGDQDGAAAKSGDGASTSGTGPVLPQKLYRCDVAGCDRIFTTHCGRNAHKRVHNVRAPGPRPSTSAPSSLGQGSLHGLSDGHHPSALFSDEALMASLSNEDLMVDSHSVDLASADLNVLARDLLGVHDSESLEMQSDILQAIGITGARRPPKKAASAPGGLGVTKPTTTSDSAGKSADVAVSSASLSSEALGTATGWRLLQNSPTPLSSFMGLETVHENAGQVASNGSAFALHQDTSSQQQQQQEHQQMQQALGQKSERAPAMRSRTASHSELSTTCNSPAGDSPQNTGMQGGQIQIINGPAMMPTNLAPHHHQHQQLQQQQLQQLFYHQQLYLQQQQQQQQQRQHQQQQLQIFHVQQTPSQQMMQESQSMVYHMGLQQPQPYASSVGQSIVVLPDMHIHFEAFDEAMRAVSSANSSHPISLPFFASPEEMNTLPPGSVIDTVTTSVEAGL